jgi:hypothetical protein
MQFSNIPSGIFAETSVVVVAFKVVVVEGGKVVGILCVEVVVEISEDFRVVAGIFEDFRVVAVFRGGAAESSEPAHPKTRKTKAKASIFLIFKIIRLRGYIMRGS